MLLFCVVCSHRVLRRSYSRAYATMYFVGSKVSWVLKVAVLRSGWGLSSWLTSNMYVDCVSYIVDIAIYRAWADLRCSSRVHVSNNIFSTLIQSLGFIVPLIKRIRNVNSPESIVSHACVHRGRIMIRAVSHILGASMVSGPNSIFDFRIWISFLIWVDLSLGMLIINRWMNVTSCDVLDWWLLEFIKFSEIYTVPSVKSWDHYIFRRPSSTVRPHLATWSLMIEHLISITLSQIRTSSVWSFFSWNSNPCWSWHFTQAAFGAAPDRIVLDQLASERHSLLCPILSSPILISKLLFLFNVACETVSILIIVSCVNSIEILAPVVILFRRS